MTLDDTEIARTNSLHEAHLFSAVSVSLLELHANQFLAENPIIAKDMSFYVEQLQNLRGRLHAVARCIAHEVDVSTTLHMRQASADTYVSNLYKALSLPISMGTVKRRAVVQAVYLKMLSPEGVRTALANDRDTTSKSLDTKPVPSRQGVAVTLDSPETILDVCTVQGASSKKAQTREIYRLRCQGYKPEVVIVDVEGLSNKKISHVICVRRTKK